MIKDSGERTQFASGAVRDMHEGKGRFDLLPMCVLTRLAQPPDVYMWLDLVCTVRYPSATVRTFSVLRGPAECPGILS